MRVPLSWLRELCPVELSADELAELLVARGVHVEDVLRPWNGLSGVVAARIVEVADHPDSDKLCLARVDPGGEARQVVVGVRNMSAGDVVPYAPPGARVPALPEPLEARRLRGQLSDGMLCSPRELGISADHGGILILPPEIAPGANVKERLGLDDDVLDIEVEPNRPDLMSVLGVAREAAAATGSPLRLPDSEPAEADRKAAELAKVEVRDREGCPRYLARVLTGVRVAPSPLEVQARLTASGMRPVSNVVDATNYAMLELGHPMHPFDLALLEGSAIVVRRAEQGERLETLDGVDRALEPTDLLIADRSRAVGIAGVMGSASSEVSGSTTDVLLESAYFDRVSILRTARRLALQTEASIRFERGSDPEAVERSAGRAALLMSRWAGGSVLAGTVDVGGVPERRRVILRPDRASRVLGFGVAAEEIVESFSAVGIPARPSDAGLEVEVPGFRADLEREIDLLEEVARLRGYDRVGSTVPGVKQAGGLQPSYAHRRRVRMALVRAGMRETISGSFASPEDLELTGEVEGVRLANPLIASDSFLRRSLLPSLLRAVARNQARHVRGAALFEVGRVFRPGEAEVLEHDSVAFAMAGDLSPGLHGAGRDVDFFDAKGVIEGLVASLGIDLWRMGGPGGSPFHPGRSARLEVGGEDAGVIGELHPRAAEGLDLRGPVVAGEVDSGLLSRHARATVEYRDVTRFPPVRRDLAFLLDQDVPVGAVEEVLREAGGELADAVVLFDVFEGAPLPEGKKSVAFSVDFRAPDRTLTDAEVDATVASMAQRLGAELGADLRAG